MNYRLPIGLVVAILALSACQEDAYETGKTSTQQAPAQKAMPAGTKPVQTTAPAQPLANSPNVVCNVEYMADALLESAHPEITKSNSVRLAGWYFDRSRANEPFNIYLDQINGPTHLKVDIATRAERPDVATAQNEPAAAYSGFDVAIDLSDLPAGDYSITLADAGRTVESICGVGRGFTMK